GHGAGRLLFGGFPEAHRLCRKLLPESQFLVDAPAFHGATPSKKTFRSFWNRFREWSARQPTLQLKTRFLFAARGFYVSSTSNFSITSVSASPARVHCWKAGSAIIVSM